MDGNGWRRARELQDVADGLHVRIEELDKRIEQLEAGLDECVRVLTVRADANLIATAVSHARALLAAPPPEGE